MSARTGGGGIGRRLRVRLRWTAAAAAMLMAGIPGGVRAQQQQQQQQQQEQPVDSTRLRALQRLQRLGRRLGSDSLLFLQDSLRKAELSEGRGRSGAAPRGDSTLAALMGMRGYAVIQYEGGRADFSAADRVLVLQSDSAKRAHVVREGMDVSADSSITYSELTGRVRTVGQSTFTPPTGETVESKGLVYDLEGGVGSALGARTAYDQGGANWYVSGDMPLAAQDSSFMSHAIFTSCDLTVPHYHFETDEIKIVGGKVLIARPVRLYFADVPVAWLPFIAQSLSRDRASGILQPVFSVNDIVRNSTGYQRRISNLGFYWAMSDYSDAIVAFDWFSGNYKALTGQVNYRWNKQFLNGNLGFREYWQADGGTQQALDTNHSWQMDERTQIRVSARYITSTDFLQQNSFNPAEVTQSINSQGGINRRFDWGSMSVSANRQQYLSDNRITQTLPSVNLNLSTITLFKAPQNRASFYNNMTWSGSAKFDRKTVGRDNVVGDVFSIAQANTENRSSGVSSSLSLGNLSFSQSVSLDEKTTQEVPEAWSPNTTDTTYVGDPSRPINNQDLTWTASLSYLQHLIGSTTLTPSLSFSGHSFRSDTLQAISGYVAEPARVSLSASLKSDIYGFWPGFAGFEAVRHKFSPSFQYSWAPESQPSPLQQAVFGPSVLQARNSLSITINNTIEAKRAAPEDTASTVSMEDLPADSLAADSLAADSSAVDSLAAPAPESGQRTGAADDEPRRQERADVVQLLGLRTSVVQYDFVQADSSGFFLAGFKTTSLSNQISSDFLQGLTVSMDHELWKDSTEIGEDGRRVLVDRQFSLHLSQLNLSFSLNPRSQIVRLLGFGGNDGNQQDEVDEEETDSTNVATYTSPVVDESSIIPSPGGRRRNDLNRGGFGSGNSWSANLSYSLRRPRARTSTQASQTSQMVNGSVTLRPTAKWNMSWRTSYDLELHRFNDHSVRLTRDLHRWEANFDFLKTATGNWQFRFEVSLTDNRDLKFDYQQHNNVNPGGAFTRPTAR